jgi:RimJ/RimL family protein N-acetyltransferase
MGVRLLISFLFHLYISSYSASQHLLPFHLNAHQQSLNEYSLAGPCKSLEETEKVVAGALLALSTTRTSTQSAHRVFYAVHELLSMPDTNEPATKFIGTVLLRTLEDGGLELSPPLVPALSSPSNKFLTLELAYQFLPAAWGKGYAGESINAVFEACTRKKAVWQPYERVYCRVIVNAGNPASLRVMRKLGVREMGIYKWMGKIWLAGGWRFEDDLHIFGKWLVGQEE